MAETKEKQPKSSAETAEVNKESSNCSAFSETQYLAHLAMIQGVISRMADNSFKIKGLAITVAGAIWALNPDVLQEWLLLIVILMFWVLDAYYLHLERGFRNCYNRVRQNMATLTDFKIAPESGDIQIGVIRMMVTKSVWPLYFALFAVQSRDYVVSAFYWISNLCNQNG